MKIFGRRYDSKETEKIKAFHLSRRMFCIYQDELFIAEPNLPYSHTVWFEKKDWISKEKSRLMDKIVRGIVNNKGDIYFYVGYNFEINPQIESLFFSHLEELAKKLNLKPTSKIFGGAIRGESGKMWLPKKEYGEIKDNL